MGLSLRGRVGLAVASVMVVGTGGCTGKDPYNPGDSLGTFGVEATRLTASCGDAQTPPDPWRFDVRLSHDGRRLYWLQGGAPVAGSLDANDHTTMHSEDGRTLREATKSPARAACAVRRTDDLETTLENRAPAGSSSLDVRAFSGKLTYRFTIVEGSDCTDVVEAGTFATLPCEVSFALKGSPKSK